VLFYLGGIDVVDEEELGLYGVGGGAIEEGKGHLPSQYFFFENHI
jgi:hypothetical protein